MILLTFWDDNELRLGVKTRRGVVDIPQVSQALPPELGRHVPLTMDEFLRGGDEAKSRLEAALAWAAERQAGSWLREESELCLGPCVPHPNKIICVGLNYQSHVAEVAASVHTEPTLFAKFPNAIAASQEAIPIPADVKNIDYEAELGVVLGKQAKNVAEEEALNYVLGYCIINDLTARDLQFRTTQWLLGKTPDKFMPIGPYLVTAEEIPNPQELRIRTWVNGTVRQDSTTAHMIFPVATLIAYISRYISLLPGDVISTGTPDGVIHGSQRPIWLVPGDEIAIEIDSLGRLRNVIKG